MTLQVHSVPPLAGIDFTSRPTRRKPITVALGAVAGGSVRLDRIETHADFDSFAVWLRRPGPWLGVFDLPFGLPRELVRTLGWPLDWLPLMRHYASLSREDIRTTFAACCAARPVGHKFAHRASDGPAGASTSMKWVNPPVAYMLHAGIPLLLDAGVHLPGLHAGDLTRVALEGYPGLLAREVLGRRSYKNDTLAKQTAARRLARAELVDALGLGRTRLGLRLHVDAPQREALIDDPSADRLDAVLCLVQAAWAAGRPNHGLPDVVDPLEGWIVSAEPAGVPPVCASIHRRRARSGASPPTRSAGKGLDPSVRAGRRATRPATSPSFPAALVALLWSPSMNVLYLLLLASGLLVFTSLLAGVFSARLGLPFLLVFLVAGMLVGVDGPIGLEFDNVQLSAWVGNAALAVILLEGGLSTRMRTFHAGVRPALVLATVGVALTAVMVGGVAMAMMGIDWRYGLLLGAIVGSTDAAAVFSLLRQTGVRLSERVSSTLELESSLNDPTAVFLTLAMIATIRHGAGVGEALLLFAQQAGLGALIGLGAAWLVGGLLRRLTLTVEHGGVLSLIIVSGGMVVFATSGLAGGSGFLAIYLFGMQVRARAEPAAHAASSALDGFAWAAQATLFLLLGLLVTPHEMLRSIGTSVAVAGTLIFVARPLAVWLCLLPMRFPHRERLFIGWVGLRGAVPIVLALFPLLDKVPESHRFFNITFAVVLASLLLQGTTLAGVARWLRVEQPPQTPPPEQRAVQGRLTLDAELPVAETFDFFQLPVPDDGAETLRDWLTDNLARDAAVGDGVDWHGARFSVNALHEGRIARIRLALAPREKPAG